MMKSNIFALKKIERLIATLKAMLDLNLIGSLS